MRNKKKQLVGVVVGSTEEEHDQSVKDGLQVAEKINSSGKFDACVVEVLTDQPWKMHFGTECADMDKMLLRAKIDGKTMKPEVVLLQTRGKLGESGELQSFFDREGIPFSNSGAIQTRNVNNKYETINELRGIGLPVPRSLLFKSFDIPKHEELVERIEKRIGFPCYVKPNTGSRGMGITKVNTSDDLQTAIKTAQKIDDDIFFESAVENGFEVTCTIHDITSDDMLEHLAVTELGVKSENIPEITNGDAPIPNPNDELINEVIKISKLAYRALKLTGLATFDLIIQNNELPVLLEINPVPLVGPNSIVEKQIQSGLSLTWQRNMPKFYDILVDHAIYTFQFIRLGNQHV